MNKSFLKNKFYIFLLALSLGCKQNSSLPIIETNIRSDHDGIVRDIPSDHKSERQQILRQKAEGSLGLQSLQNGSQGLEIRIWEGDGMTYEGRLFLIRNDGNSWKGELYYYKDSFSRHNEEGKTASYQGATAIEKLELKQTSREWIDFVNRLFELEIHKLRDYRLIPNFYPDTDDGGVLIEVAQRKFYKVYQMPTPSDRENTIKDAKQVVRILEFIDRKFGNKLKD